VRILSVQNEFRLNSGIFAQTGKIHSFTVLQIYSPELGSLGKGFQLNFLKCINIQDFSSKISCLHGNFVSGVDFEPKDSEFSLKAAQKSVSSRNYIPKIEMIRLSQF
jgi:hypothetical protein